MERENIIFVRFCFSHFSAPIKTKLIALYKDEIL